MAAGAPAVAVGHGVAGGHVGVMSGSRRGHVGVCLGHSCRARRFGVAAGAPAVAVGHGVAGGLSGSWIDMIEEAHSRPAKLSAVGGGWRCLVGVGSPWGGT